MLQGIKDLITGSLLSFVVGRLLITASTTSWLLVAGRLLVLSSFLFAALLLVALELR